MFKSYEEACQAPDTVLSAKEVKVVITHEGIIVFVLKEDKTAECPEKAMAVKDV